jgi:TolB-like protein
MTTGPFAALCALALGVIPTLNHDQDQAAQPGRSDEPAVRNVKIGAAALSAAREHYAGRAGIAVLPIVTPKADPALTLAALGCAATLNADLRYAPAFLVRDRTEVVRVLRSESAAESIGRRLGVRYVITGSLSRDATGDRLDIQALEIGAADKEAAGHPLVQASARRFSGQLHELVDTALIDLLGQLKATPPPDRLAEINRVPTMSDSARGLCDDGFALLDRSDSLFRGDEPALLHRALKDSEAALKADPRYLRAALLQASCLLRLGETDRLETCLTQAYETRIPDTRIDALTRLEVDGDYAALVKHDLTTAVSQYEKILEIDPGHLHALWMLTALHAGEFPPGQWAGYSLEKAGVYAARLIVAHPETVAARMLKEGQR